MIMPEVMVIIWAKGNRELSEGLYTQFSIQLSNTPRSVIPTLEKQRLAVGCHFIV